WSIMLTVLGIGLQGHIRDLAFALGRPKMLLKAMVAVNLVVPLVAIGLCFAFPIPSTTRAGIVIMAVSPVCSLALGKMLKSGADHDYVIGLYAALILASIVLVPLTIVIVDAFVAR